MEEVLRQELLAKTKQALDADDWNAVLLLWQPSIEQGDAEAEYQLAYNYLRCTPCDDDATCDEMKELLRGAAAKNHPDAIWFLASRELDENSPEFATELLRAGRLGSVHAQRALGVRFATGDWSGPQDLAEAARWYRLGAEKGELACQYDLGFMQLLGEGGPKNTDEGLMWLERAGAQGEPLSLRLLVDCYESGYYDVSIDAAKAQLWRSRLEDYKQLNPPMPRRWYESTGEPSKSSLECLLDIEGVTGCAFASDDKRFSVEYDAEVITPAELDEQVQGAGFCISSAEWQVD